MLKDEESYQAAKQVTFSINLPGLETFADRLQRRQAILDNLLDDPYDAKYYVGWRGRCRRFKQKLTRLFGRKNRKKL